RQDLSGALSPTDGRRESRLPTLPGPRPLPLVYLQRVRQRGRAGQWLFDPLQDWTYRCPLESPDRGNDQDGHDQPRSGRLVRLLLMRRRAGTTASCNWKGDGYRSWAGSLCHPQRWNTYLLSRLVQESRTCLENGATPCLTPQEGEPSQAQGASLVGESASES